jgi:hypothetical protein
MRKIWTGLSLLFLIIFNFQCAASPQYWTYHQGNIPSHISHVQYIPVWIDAAFTPPQVEEFKAAITEWNYVFNGQIVIYLATRSALGTDKKMHQYPITFAGWDAGQAIVKQCDKTGSGWVILSILAGDPKLQAVGAPEGTLAYVEGEGAHSIVVVIDRFGVRSLKDVTMHEMAHLFGALHVNNPSLENPYYGNNQYDCIDKETVLQVASQQHLDFTSLSYCVTPNEI